MSLADWHIGSTCRRTYQGKFDSHKETFWVTNNMGGVLKLFFKIISPKQCGVPRNNFFLYDKDCRDKKAKPLTMLWSLGKVSSILKYGTPLSSWPKGLGFWHIA